ncbi:DinB family protein [Paenibacillus sp. NPDC056579]|uniref:DinB family protein n=1 Tax=Paenibacillus sp. NPDC056579 TaxID=3345871 RepID=UPI0036A4295E
MYVSIQNFVEEYRNEAAATLRLLEALTDESLKQEVAPGYRTIGHLAWHLVPNGGILKPTGLRYDAPEESIEPPVSAAAIAEAYRFASESLLEAVEAQWTDEKLQDTSTIFGEQWKNGKTLDLFVKHEIHHRGQLTVLMRQAGVKMSGVYGPTKEEWAAIGVPAPV